MKRSIRDTGDGSSAQKPPAKRAATAKRAAASKKTAAQATESPEPVVIAGPAPAASPSPSSSIPNTRRVPVGPNGEFFIPRTFPRESIKALDKMVVSKRWVQIDGDPNHEFTLGNRRWWELNSPWLEANKKSIGLTAKHWKMREEAFAKGEPRGDDEGDNPEDFVCISPPALEARDSEEDEDEDEDEEEEEDEENEEENEEAAEEAKASKEKAKEEQCAMHKVVGKLASLHPEHKWVSTMRGNERSKWWISELLKRDQDDFLMHVYNDFTWYGTIEVMENIVSICMAMNAPSQCQLLTSCYSLSTLKRCSSARTTPSWNCGLSSKGSPWSSTAAVSNFRVSSRLLVESVDLFND
jgi:hypothetical protein